MTAFISKIVNLHNPCPSLQARQYCTLRYPVGQTTKNRSAASGLRQTSTPSYIKNTMEPTKAPWADQEIDNSNAHSASVATTTKKLPMEPTKAPWADGGIGRVFAAPEPGPVSGNCPNFCSTLTSPHHWKFSTPEGMLRLTSRSTSMHYRFTI